MENYAKVYDSTEGIIMVTKVTARKWYCEIDNKWDALFNNKKDFENFLKKHNAVYIGEEKL